MKELENDLLRVCVCVCVWEVRDKLCSQQKKKKKKNFVLERAQQKFLKALCGWELFRYTSPEEAIFTMLNADDDEDYDTNDEKR